MQMPTTSSCELTLRVGNNSLGRSTVLLQQYEEAKAGRLLIHWNCKNLLDGAF
jgi:hypothetical protein